jgi:hypothetical protein
MLSGMKGKIAAAFTVGAAIKIGKDALAMGDALGEAATNLGITTDELQALSFMFKTTGSSAETFERAMNKINGAIGDSQNGSDEVTEKLAKMGVTMDMIDAGNPAAVLEQMAKYLDKCGYSAASVADVFEFLGEKSKNMSNGMKELGKNGLSGVIKGASDAGRVLSRDEIASLGVAQDKIDAAIDWARKKAAQGVAATASVVTKPDLPNTREEMRKRGEEARARADAASAAKLTEDAAEIRAKNVYDALDTEGKITALKREQADLDAKMAEAKTQTARAELDKQRAESEGKLASLEAGNVKPGAGMAYDQLRRIGAGVFSGTASDAIPKNQLAELRKISLSMNRLETKKATGGVF